MSDYDFRPGGSLKLKGGVIDGGVVKKRKKKSKPKNDDNDGGEKERSKSRELDKVKELLLKEDEAGSSSISGNSGTSGRNSPAVPASTPNKTEAEKRFEEVQQRRLAQRVQKMAHKTHKERVDDLNKHLESLSEHHDIPKVGPG
ncbi:DUF1754-domain-containing protein [Pluteus cervinus]|uniref:DUF1754-domain-containing protein n=1 Tax=Pluteus cervinus TaxID=181527 RepID=A0ACD3BI28_9AGAR|nr:DUF1754-domain-containing protein [Pluteus cervinus]